MIELKYIASHGQINQFCLICHSIYNFVNKFYLLIKHLPNINTKTQQCNLHSPPSLFSNPFTPVQISRVYFIYD